MGPNGKDPGSGEMLTALVAESESPDAERRVREHDAAIVFDFTGLHRPGLGDLALILTARFHAEPGERVWVRALPDSTWAVLQALGLDHLFHLIPSPGEVRN